VTPSVIGENTGPDNPYELPLDQYSEAVRRVSRKTKAGLCDMRKVFLRHLAKHNPNHAAQGVLTVDRVHLTPKGNQLASEALVEALLKN
jgi:isoamyl acetate esterase